MTNKSNLELLGQFRRESGLVMRLRPYENVVKVTVDDTKAAILIETFRFKELAREVRFKARGEKLIGFIRAQDVWLPVGELVTWDESFVPFTHVKYGKSVSPREHAARRQWERECYRPGSEVTPLDSYSRVLSGPTTEAMERYW